MRNFVRVLSVVLLVGGLYLFLKVYKSVVAAHPDGLSLGAITTPEWGQLGGVMVFNTMCVVGLMWEKVVDPHKARRAKQLAAAKQAQRESTAAALNALTTGSAEE